MKKTLQLLIPAQSGILTSNPLRRMMNRTSVVILTAAWLFGGVGGAAESPGSPSPAKPGRQITIKITVDTTDKIMVRGKHLWIEHQEPGAKPEGISVNGHSWKPFWHGNKTDLLNRFGVVLEPFENARVTLHKKEGRGTVTLEQQPTAENQQTIVIVLDDHFSGPGVYEVTVSW